MMENKVDEFVAGLRAMADWYEQHPEIDTPTSALMVSSFASDENPELVALVARAEKAEAALDEAWKRINSLGGPYFPSRDDDQYERTRLEAHNDAVGGALKIIETLGGMDARARIRELASGRDDFDRAVLMVLDDFAVLARKLRDCVRRLETIRETHPDIKLDDDIARARAVLDDAKEVLPSAAIANAERRT